MTPKRILTAALPGFMAATQVFGVSFSRGKATHARPGLDYARRGVGSER